MMQLPSLTAFASRNLNIVLIAGTCVVTTGLLLYLVKRRRKDWVQNVAIIKSLVVYPIKSVPGLQVNQVEVSKNGFSHGKFTDRGMILLNKEKRMITLRHEPRLALIRTKIGEDEESLELSAPGMDQPLIVHPKQRKTPFDQIISFTIWSTPTEGIEVSDEASDWFSKYLNQEVLLVQHLPSFQMRPTFHESKSGGELKHTNPIRYQDGSPVHLVNEMSILEANSLLPEDDSTNFDNRNFRANVVVTNAAAHQEENWLFVRFNGKLVCENVRLCTRCAVPTVDSDKGLKISSKTQVLQQFRSPLNEYETKNYETSPLFGTNLCPQSDGHLEVGMSVDAVFK